VSASIGALSVAQAVGEIHDHLPGRRPFRPARRLLDRARYRYLVRYRITQECRIISAGDATASGSETSERRGFGVRHCRNGVCTGAQSKPCGNRCELMTHIVENVLRSNPLIAIRRQIGGEAKNAAVGFVPCRDTGHRLTVLPIARQNPIEVLLNRALRGSGMSGQMQVSSSGVGCRQTGQRSVGLDILG